MATLQRTALIVDDNPEDADTFRRYLEHDRETYYRCQIVSTVAEGMQACRTLRPDVVLLDYDLPDDTGLAFLAALRSEYGPMGCAVVMLTGSGDEAVAVEALKLGAQDYLVKDTDFQQRLIVAVGSAIEKIELQRQVEQQRRDLEASNSQLRQALDAQQASQAQLQLALQSAQMTTWEWDLATNQVRWGAGLAAMVGMRDEDFGGTLDAFTQLLHPDDAALVRDRLDQALHHDAPYEIEFRMLRPDGSTRWTATRGSVIRDPEGRPIRMIGVDMDVSERKQAEAELRESEARYRALVTATSDLIWRAGASGEMMSISPWWHELTGQTQEELRGWGWAATIHPDDAEPAVRRWQAALAARSIYENEFRVRTRDGSYRLFQGRGVPIIAADGGVREWIGYSSDITEHRRIADQLRRSEAQFKTLVENAHDIISRFDRELRHIYVSPSIERVTGLSQAAFIGKTNRDLGMPSTQCASWDDHLLEVFETGRQLNIEFEFQTAEGTRYYQSTLIPELGPDGTVETIMSIARDVTIYKQAEARMRFLSDASKALTSSLDYRTTLEHTARLAIPFLGDACIIDLVGEQRDAHTSLVAHIDPDQEALLREMRQQYPPLWSSAHPAAQVLRSGQPLILDKLLQATIEAHQLEHRHRVLVEQLNPRAVIMLPLVVRGRGIGVLSVCTTNTPRCYTSDDLALAEELARRAAIALDNARLYEEAQEAIREREAFLLIASHEVRNPLTTLLGRSQMLQRRLERRGDSPRELVDIDTVIESAQRINQMLSDLLDTERLNTEQISIDPALLDLVSLVNKVVSEIQPSAPIHPIDLREYAPSLMIAGDASRLEQVFHNLISNAIKYSPAGGTIQVEAAIQDTRARITVSDSGLGIPADALPNLFKRFYRVSRSSAQQIAGTGIGLYVVKEIVSSHGGTVEVRSSEGVGSTFTVYLPLASEEHFI